MQSFCKYYGSKSLIKKATCFKNSVNPSCIGFIITSKYLSFQNSCTKETGYDNHYNYEKCAEAYSVPC